MFWVGAERNEIEFCVWVLQTSFFILETFMNHCWIIHSFGICYTFQRKSFIERVGIQHILWTQFFWISWDFDVHSANWYKQSIQLKVKWKRVLIFPIANVAQNLHQLTMARYVLGFYVDWQRHSGSDNNEAHISIVFQFQFHEWQKKILLHWQD